MKKLLVGTVIPEGSGTCDFCQGHTDSGFVGSDTFSYKGAEYAGRERIIRGDWSYNIFSQKVIKDWDYIDVYKEVGKTIDIKPLICKSCVKQLADIK